MNPTNRRRPAFSLVEVIASAAIMAALTTASFALIRTANDAWRRHRDDSQQRREALATLQHIVRQVRQATEVVAFSASTDASGFLTLLMADGTTAMWDHDAAVSQVKYGVSAPTDLLSEGITQMYVTAMSANGIGTTTDPARAHAVHCLLRYNLNRPGGTVTETVANVAWLRAW